MSQNLGLDVFFRQSEAGPVESERKSTPSTAAPTGKPPASVEEFVAQVTPAAERVAQRLGVPVSAVIGQWGVETGWGKSVIPGTNNLGNIKSTDGTGVFATDNYNGSRDRYRAYQSVDQFADDFARLLENRRYSGARGAQDAQTYFTGLQRGGYAEHPDYVSISVNAANMVDRVLGKQPRQSGDQSAPKAEAPQRDLPDLTKAPAWAEIAKNPEYQKLSKEERAAAKSAYFDYWIAPHGGDAQLRSQFIGMADPEIGMLDRVKNALPSKDDLVKGAKEVGDFALQMTDPTGIVRKVVDGISGKKPSVMDGANADALTPQGVTRSDAPVRPEVRRAIENKYNSLTPEQRIAMGQQEGFVGQIATELNQRYGLLGKRAEQRAGAPGISPTEQFDPRREARERRLVVKEGMDPLAAQERARTGAAFGMTPGTEVTGTVGNTDFDFETAEAFRNTKGLNNPLTRGLAKGGLGLLKGYAGVGEAMSDLAFGQSGNSASRWARGKEEAIGEGGTFLERNLEGAIASLGQQLPLMVAGAATGGAAIPLAGMAMQSFGQEYTDGKSRGLDPTSSAQRAGIFAAFEVIGESFGLGSALNLIKKSAKGIADPSDLRRFISDQIVKQVPGEVLTTTGQFLTDKIPGMGLNLQAGLDEYLKQVGDTITQTVMQGGLTAGGTTGVNRAVQYLNQGDTTSDEAQFARTLNREISGGEWSTPAQEAGLAKFQYGEPGREINIGRAPQADLTADGRLEPRAPVSTQPPVGAADPTAGAPPVNPPTQPTQAQPSQDADAIVRELAQQAGVPLETVLPGAPAGAQQFPDNDVLEFAQTRLEALQQKRDGGTRAVIGEQGEVVDQEVPGTPLSPAEADELALLEMAGNDAQALREFYGFNNQGVQNEALRQDQANGPASGADALGAAGLAGGPAAVTQPAADAAAGQGNAQGGEQQQGLSQQAVETDAEREARIEREAIQGEMPIATREPPDDLIERAKAAKSLEELSAITQEALNRYPDSDPLGDGPSNDDDRNVAAVVQAARARVNELESKPKTEREARERREQEANAAQSQQVAGETPSAQGSQAGSEGSDQRRTTPGTRVSFGNVNEWVSGYREIDRRAPSSNRYRQLDAHVNELTDDFIAAETDADALTQLRSLFETANGLKPPRGQRAGSAYERVINAIDRRLTALTKPKTEREAREQRAAEQQSNVVSRIPAPDGMEVQVFKTSDGHGYGLYDKDAGQYVNGSVTRFSKGDTLAQATQGANELAKKATPVANKETETSEPAPAVKTDVFYDRQTRSWIVSRKDAQGNQVGDAEFFGSKGEAERAAGISPRTEKEARELRARQEESNAGTPGEVAPSDVRVAGDQPTGDARDQQGAGEGAGRDVGSAAGASTPSSGSDRTVQDAESERPAALDRPKTEREAREQRRPAVSENKVFTEDAAAKARELLKKKLSGSQLNAGIDPEVMQAGITLAGYHIEKGARTFAAFARAMLADLGDAVRPYLKSWYMGVKYDPRAAEFSQGMDDAASVEAADVNGDFAEQAAEEPAPQAEPTGPDLSGVKVTFEVLVEDTGETAKMTVNAAEQVKELDERESLMRELIACLRK